MQGFQEVMEMMNGEGGLKNVMLQESFEYDEESEHTFSQAELIADVVNILRMDTKKMAEAHGVDVEINQMTPEYAAELLQGVAKGGDLGLVEIFDEIEDQRLRILAEIEGMDEVEAYQERKQRVLYCVPDSAPTSTPDVGEGSPEAAADGGEEEEVDEDED